METKNSELDLMIELTTDLLADIADLSGLNMVRDVREVRRRTLSEGASFLTKRLPALGKALDCALSKADTVMDYTGFKTRGGYPEFLGDLFRRCFDRAGRSLLDVSPLTDCLAAVAVRYIRQILYLWYKYELPYTKAQETDLEDRFIATEAALPDTIPSCPVIQGAGDLIARVVADFHYENLAPRHGPGAVATGELPWEKWRFKRLYQPIERIFPFSEWYIPSLSYLARSKDPLGDLEILKEGTAKAVFVPKDSRGPRLISCEPLEYQWLQQGIAAEMITCINRNRLTSGRVNFTHQEVNRRYALYGSMGAGWVTLDMADASDRVSTILVERLFAKSHVLEYLLASRTQCTVLPSGRKVRMKKFAPMGSALCFPVESLVFFALAVNVLVHHLGYTLETACERVKVYGDDLILGKEDYLAVMQYFPYVGLMFNAKKCCTSGFFRESCGLDSFCGVDVTPIKFRTRLSRRRDTACIASWIQYSNALDLRGYSRVARRIEGYVWSVFPTDCGAIPYICHEHPPVAFLSYRRHDAHNHTGVARGKGRTRWNDKFQRIDFLGYTVGGLSIRRDINGWERLFAALAATKTFAVRPGRNVPAAEELPLPAWMYATCLEPSLYPVRRRVTLKRRWCAYSA